MITIVFYYGEKEWDGSRNLHEMINKNFPTAFWEKIKPYIPNYHINLVDPKVIKDFEKFQTDLQVIFGMLQYKNNKSMLMEYVMQHKAYFENVDEETYNVIREFLNSGKVLNAVVHKDAGGEINMCKALQDLYDEGVECGIEKGIERGRKEAQAELQLAHEENERLEAEIQRLRKVLAEKEKSC